jgi:hypothetical protein
MRDYLPKIPANAMTITGMNMQSAMQMHFTARPLFLYEHAGLTPKGLA